MKKMICIIKSVINKIILFNKKINIMYVFIAGTICALLYLISNNNSSMQHIFSQSGSFASLSMLVTVAFFLLLDLLKNYFPKTIRCILMLNNYFKIPTIILMSFATAVMLFLPITYHKAMLNSLPIFIKCTSVIIFYIWVVYKMVILIDFIDIKSRGLIKAVSQSSNVLFY